MLLWDSINGGQPSFWPNCSFGLEPIWWLFQSIHLPVNVVQIIFYTFSMLGSGLSMYFLASTIYKNQKIVPLVASTLFMFCVYRLEWIWWPGFLWTLGFLPLLMALYVKIVENSRNHLSVTKYILLFIVASMVLLCGQGIDVSLRVISLVSVGLIFLYCLIVQSGSRFRLIKISALLLAITIVANIWWLVPFYNYYAPHPNFTWGISLDITQWSWAMARSSFLNLFWASSGPYWEETYPFSQFYANAVLIVLTFVPVFLAFSALLFRKHKYARLNLFLGAIILCALFLQKGLHAPLSNVNLFLYQHIPFAYAFRSAESKFGLFLLPFLALITGSSAQLLFEFIHAKKIRIQKFFAYAVTGIIIAIFLIASFPLVTGQVLERNLNSIPSHANIPEYWYQASDWINSQDGDFRVLITPNDYNSNVIYTWDCATAQRLAPRFINKPLLELQPMADKVNNYYSGLIVTLYDTIRNNNVSQFQELLDDTNVRYILQCNDVTWLPADAGQIIPPSLVKSFLSNQPDIKLVKQFGELDIYEYQNLTTTHIWAASVNTGITDRNYGIVFGATQVDGILPDSSGKPGKALQFDGVDDYVYCGNDESLQLTNTVTVEAWVNVLGNSSKDQCEPISKGGAYGWQQKSANQPYNWRFHIYDNNNQWYNLPYVDIGTGWHYVVGTYDKNLPSGNLKEYVDGTLRYQMDYTSGINDKTVEPFQLGRVYDRYANLIIDGVRVSDIARSPAEIAGNWNDGTGKALENDQHTAALWALDESSGDTLYNKPGAAVDADKSLPTIAYQQINPVKYHINIQNATQPFTLVFAESFDPQWKAYYGRVNWFQALWQKPVDAKHAQVAGYANGWYLDKTGNYDITLYYRPQSLFYSGVIISGLSICGIAGYLIWEHRRKKHTKRE